MKRKAALFLLTVMIALSAGCSAPAGEVDVSGAARALSEGLPFANPLSPLETDAAVRLYEISPEDVEEAAVYVGTGGAVVDEISVWKAKDKEATARIEKAVRERVQTQTVVYEDYQPGEVPKLADPLLLTHGNEVILCVSGFDQQARELLSDYLS